MTVADEHQRQHHESKATTRSTATTNEKEKNTTSVDIQNSTYRILAAKAEEKDLSTRKYINDLLYLLTKKQDFIKKYCPDIYLDTTGKNSLYLKDYRPVLDDSSIGSPKTAEISIIDNKVYCSLDKCNDCVHIHFAYCLPDIAVLLRERDNEQREEEQQQERIADNEEIEEDTAADNKNKKKMMPHIAPSSLISVALSGAALSSIMYLTSTVASTNLIHHASHILTHLAG